MNQRKISEEVKKMKQNPPCHVVKAAKEKAFLRAALKARCDDENRPKK